MYFYNIFWWHFFPLHSIVMRCKNHIFLSYCQLLLSYHYTKSSYQDFIMILTTIPFCDYKIFTTFCNTCLSMIILIERFAYNEIVHFPRNFDTGFPRTTRICITRSRITRFCKRFQVLAQRDIDSHNAILLFRTP